MKSNSITGQVTTNMAWQQLPVSNTQRDWMLHVEGAEVLLFIGDGAPSNGAAFKVPGDAAIRWYATVQPVYVKGVDLATVVYYLS